MTKSRSADKRKVAENVGKIAGPTYGFWHPYALGDREIRISVDFRGMREFVVSVCPDNLLRSVKTSSRQDGGGGVMIELQTPMRCVTITLAGLLLIGSAPTPQQAAPKVESVAAPVARAAEKPEQVSEVAPESPPLGRPCEPGTDTRTSELCAQWKAADAAADSAWWAKTGGALGFASLLGVLAALGLAFHSNWIARDTARRQLRAYLTFTQFILKTDKNDWTPQIEWENRGQTPALAVETNVGFEFCVDPLPDDFTFPNGPSRGEEGPTPIGPGQTVQGTSEVEMDKTFLYQASRGLRHVYVWGSAKYIDIFGDHRKTLVALKLDCEELSPGSYVMRWVTINRHNEMT